MSYFKAGTLDVRNAGSRIGIRGDGEDIYGVIATVRQKKVDGETWIYLTDNTEPVKLRPSQEVEIQLAAPDLAIIEIGNVVNRIERIIRPTKGDRGS